MSNDYESIVPDPLHLELMLQPPDQGTTVAQDDQGCEIETSLTTPTPPTSSTQSEGTAKTSKQQNNPRISGSNRPKGRAPTRTLSHCIYDDIKQVSDIKNCWNNLKISIVGGNLSKTAEKISEQAPESVLQIIDYISARLGEINQTIKSVPVRCKIDKEKSQQDLEFLNNLVKNLDTVPDELKIFIPDHSPLKDQITDTLLEDFLTVQKLCCNRSNLLRKHIKSYDKAIEKLKLGKKTRNTDLIIAGEKPIPQYLLQIDDNSSPEKISANPDTQGDNVPERPVDLGQATTISSVQNIVPEEASAYDRVYLSPIQEENPTTIQDEHEILDLTKKIMGKDLIDSNAPFSVHEALILLNDKLGSSLSADDPNIINAVRNLYLHKRKFESILTNSNANTILNESTATEYSDIQATILSPSILSQPLKPDIPSDLSENQPLDETFSDRHNTQSPDLANQNFDHTLFFSPENTANVSTTTFDQPAQMIEVNKLSHPLSEAPSHISDNTNNITINHDFPPAELAAILEHELLNTSKLPNASPEYITTLDDVNRHQQEIYAPSVRPKENIHQNKTTSKTNSNVELPPVTDHSVLEPRDISFSVVNDLPIKDQTRYIGDRIYPYIKRKVGNLANKLTGMILEMPRSQLIPGVKNTHTLDRMIQCAQETLEEYHQSSESFQNSPHESIPLSTMNPSHGSDNDYKSAMFQEIPSDSYQTHQLVSNSPTYNLHSSHQTYNMQSNTLPQTLTGTIHTIPTMNPTVIPTYNLSTIPHTNTMPSNFHTSYQTTTSMPTYNFPTAAMAANFPTTYQATTNIPNQMMPQGSSAFMYGYYNPPLLQPQIAMSSGQTLNSSLINPSHYYVENKDLGSFIHPESYTSKSKQPACKGTPLQKTTPIHNYQTLSPINTLKVQQNPAASNISQYDYLMHQSNTTHKKIPASISNITQNLDPFPKSHQPMTDYQSYTHHSLPSQPTHGPSSAPYKQSTHDAGMPLPQSTQNTQHKTHQHSHSQRSNRTMAGNIALIFRDRREFNTASFLIKRVINHLSNTPSMSSQQLTDVLGNMKDHSNNLVKFEEKISRFARTVMANEAEVRRYDPALYNTLLDEISQAEQLSTELQYRLYNADQVIANEKITMSHSQTNQKDLLYKEFSAGKKIGDPHIYEFLKNLENNFKISRTAEDCKAQILKNKLKGIAKLAVSDDMTDYKQICNHLLQKFGDTIDIIKNIHSLHEEVGKIPSKYCPRPPWQKIEETSRLHLQLIRKAELLAMIPDATPAIYNNAFRNSQLIDLMSHEWSEDLKTVKNNIEQDSLYSAIVKRFEFILTSAATNMDPTIDLKVKRKPVDRVELDSYALAYGDKRREMTIGSCSPQDCHFCTALQRIGKGKNYYQNHLLTGTNKRSYVNNCPNYLSMSIQEKNNFIFECKFCQFCLKPKSQCLDKTCGDDHLDRQANGRKKGFVCLSHDCKNRIELCLHHKELNKPNIEARQNMLSEKYNLDMSVASFSTMQIPPHKHPRLCSPNPFIDNVIDDITNEVTESSPMIMNADSPILFVPNSNSHHIRNTKPGKAVNINDQPLLVDSQSELLADGTQLLAKDCKSIFIYSKIQGTTRALTTLFDCGGGSSLTLDSIPGRQLPACKGENGPICLQGIGSGSTIGKSYIMSLPLMEGNKVAIEAYAVPEILAPLSKIDLGPALKYMKKTVAKDNNITESIKLEIQRASIFRYIEGSLDLLLGVKLLKIFPQIVHTLPSGLSIYRMKLKPAGNANYCLGGPYQALQSLHSHFPDSALMFHELETYLAGWRENSYDLTRSHSLLNTNSEQQTNNPPRIEYFPNKEVILAFAEEDTDCQCREPLILNGEITACCNKRIRLLNLLKSKFLGDDENIIKNLDSKPYKRVDWIDAVNATLLIFTEHCNGCKKTKSDTELELANNLKAEINSLIGYYEEAFQLPKSLLALKKALQHLKRCSQNEKPRHMSIALLFGDEFKTTLKSIQDLFLAYYPKYNNTLLKAADTYLTLLTFTISDEDQLYIAKEVLTTVRDKWINLYSTDKLMLNFKGVGIKNNKILYLRPTQQEPRIKRLHKLLQEELSKRGIESATRFSPRVVIAETKAYRKGYFGNSIKKTLNEVEILNTEPTSISMLSFVPAGDSQNPFLLTLPLQKEHTEDEDKQQDSMAADPPDKKTEQHQETNQL